MKYKQSKNMLLKRRKAEKLKKQGKTIRDIMQILGYKSTSAVAHLLSKSEDNWQCGATDKLFKFFAEEHNLILTDTELNDIIHEVKKAIGA